MLGMSSSVKQKPIPASHLWLCDGKGDVYVLRDVMDCIDALRMSKLDPNLAQHEPNWEKVGSGFEQIQAGQGGLVCGIKKGNVHVRTGVTHDTPIGSEWSVAYCKAIDICVGKNCVVYLSEDMTMYMNNIANSLSEAVFLPNWSSLPRCYRSSFSREEEKFQHILMDSSDRLFGVTSVGEVFGYYSMIDVEYPSWKMMCGPPPIETGKSRFNKLLSWWKGDQDVLFRLVSVGKESLWCLRENGGEGSEVWQLVLSELTKTDGKLEIKPNWVQYQLPLSDRVIHLCEDKYTAGEMFAVCKNETQETKLVFFSLVKGKSKGKVDIEFPLSCDYNSLKSLAICNTQTDDIDESPPPTKKPKIASIYPSLGPAADDSELCCFNGDCPRCLEKESEDPYIRIPSSLMPPEYRVKIQASIPLATPAENRKNGEGAHNSRKRKNYFSNSSKSEESFSVYHSKRRKLKHPALEKSLLLSGIQVACEAPVDKAKKFQEPQDVYLELPSVLTADQVDSQFAYSFDEENRVLNNTEAPVSLSRTVRTIE